MFVSRSDVSLRCSIQRDSCVTGAKAMSASFGRQRRRRRPCCARSDRAPGPIARPRSTGFQRVAGATSASSATLRGPTRRSSNGAIDVRQLAAAISRSAGVIVTCTSFSASAKVAGDTAGPDTGRGAERRRRAGRGRRRGAARGRLLAAARGGRDGGDAGAVIRNCRRVFMARSSPFFRESVAGASL